MHAQKARAHPGISGMRPDYYAVWGNCPHSLTLRFLQKWQNAVSIAAALLRALVPDHCLHSGCLTAGTGPRSLSGRHLQTGPQLPGFNMTAELELEAAHLTVKSIDIVGSLLHYSHGGLGCFSKVLSISGQVLNVR